MTKKQKKNLKRIITALIAFVVVLVVDKTLGIAFKERLPFGLASVIKNEKIGWLLPLACYFAIYVYIGWDVLKKSALNVARGQIFDENFLMTVATIGAFGLGIYTGVTMGAPEGFDEACAVLLFYQAGEWFQSYAVGKSRKSIAELMDIRPDFARIKRENGEEEILSPEKISVGEVIRVLAGEKIPLDGVIVNGRATLDTKALRGESLPREVDAGDEVISGSVNLTGTIDVRVEKTFGESTVSKILSLVENASAKKSRSENFIARFAKFYTPAVVFAALLIAFLPPVVNILRGVEAELSSWIYRGLSFLVVSCPCALVISAPLTFFAGIGGAASKGILVKGGTYIEKLEKAKIFVFDKTGTITKGNFTASVICPKENEERILRLAAIAEKQSSHPIASSVKKAYGKEITEGYTLETVAGKGVKAVGDGVILCGNEKLMQEFGVEYTPAAEQGTVVYVAYNGKFEGYIVITDEIKEEAAEVIADLSSRGGRCVMLTGDNAGIAEEVAKKVGIKQFEAGLLPQQKTEIIELLLKEKKADEVLCFVGDGINDAPALTRADVGIAMGGAGSDAAIEASNVTLMHDDLSGVAEAKRLSRRTMRILRENVVFALGVKGIILILSAFGFANMWLAVFGDVGVAVIAILNAMRARKA